MESLLQIHCQKMGEDESDEINSLLPTSPKRALKPEVLAAILVDRKHPIRVALQDNDVYQWRPVSPVRMYHCQADQDVLIANSELTFRKFQEVKAPGVQLIDLNPAADHGGCSAPSLLAAKAWFDSLRQ